MPKTIYCPFWKWHDASCLHCEGGKISFPDQTAKTVYEGALCGNREGWRRCSIARMLNAFYDRGGEEETGGPAARRGGGGKEA